MEEILDNCTVCSVLEETGGIVDFHLSRVATPFSTEFLNRKHSYN